MTAEAVALMTAVTPPDWAYSRFPEAMAIDAPLGSKTSFREGVRAGRGRACAARAAVPARASRARDGRHSASLHGGMG
jgi:hypothetical protein